MGKIKQPVNPISKTERWFFPALTSYTYNSSGQTVDALFDAIRTSIANVREILTTDAVPTEGSTNLLTSGTVYTALGDVVHLGTTVEIL